MKHDIANRSDIELLVNSFYSTVKTDAILSPVFNYPGVINWAHHLPIMYNFWEFTLLQSGSYMGNLIDKHIVVNNKYALSDAHFLQWVALFQLTVDSLFEGPIATKAKENAAVMKVLMQIKINQHIENSKTH
jgi:hemoglobin